MAAPSVVAATTATVENGGGTSDPVVITVPSHSSGDLLIAFGVSGGSAARYFTPPAGWTDIHSMDTFTIAGATQNFQAWYRIASSEPSTYTFTVSQGFTAGRVTMISVTGAENPATIPIVCPARTSNGELGTAPAHSITPTHADSLVLRVAFSRATQAYTSLTCPSGYTEVLQSLVTPNSSEVASKVQGASATGTENWTYLPTWFAYPSTGHNAVALAPVAAGGSTSPWHYYTQQTL